MWVPGIVLFLWAAMLRPRTACVRSATASQDGMSATPLGYLDAAGPRADAILPLTWYMLLVSIARLRDHRRAAVAGRAPRARQMAVPLETRAVHRGARARAACTGSRIGLLLSALPLLVALVWTMVTLAAVSGPPAHSDLTLDVTGHQWWWEVTL